MYNRSKPRPQLFWFYIVALFIAPVAMAAPMTPKEFAQPSVVWDMQVSPDGNTVGWIGHARDMTTLYFLNLKTNKMNWLAPNSLSGSTSNKREISGFRWVDNKRVIFESGSRGVLGGESEWHFALGMGAVDCDGKNWIGLTGNTLSDQEKKERWGTYYPHGAVGHIGDKHPGTILLINGTTGGEKGSRNVEPLVFEMDTRTGKYEVLKDAPRVATGWVVDHDDRLRLAIKTIGTGWETMARSAVGEKWEMESDLSSPGGNLLPVAFGYDPDLLYVGKQGPTGTWGIYTYHVATRTLGELVLENPHFDIINPNHNPSGVGIMFSRGKRQLVGVRFMADWLTTIWLDPEFAAVQEAVDQALPQTNNLLVSWSNDVQKIIVLARTDRDPGTFYLLDRTAKSFRKLGPTKPWIDPASMAEVLPIKFKARDGMELRGYLTYPPGKARQHLPLVVLPHGGPFVRDTMDYNPVVQFLASRGYAVLQVNYRGSTGYGQPYYLAGWRQVGKKIQDDITDAVKVVIAGEVADPKRIAIMGFSFGGYSTLWALETTPELYRCGISIAGVTDFYRIIGAQNQTVRFGSYDRIPWQVYEAWKHQVGDPETDEATLKAISPLYHVDGIKVPVLVVQGTQDGIVPESQARHFITELKSHGISYESWLVKEEGHPYFTESNQTKLYEQIETFLAKNMK